MHAKIVVYIKGETTLGFKDQFHGWGVTDKGKMPDFFFFLIKIKYMLNSVKYFEG